MWQIDRGDYRRAYLAAIEVAPQALTPDLAAMLSVPQGVVLHSRYFRARNHILVMGQETSQNWTPLLAPPNEGDWARRAWAGQVGNVIDFDYAYDHPAEPNQFWQAFEQIRNIFQLPSRRSLAWSNLWKSQTTTLSRGRYSPGGLLPEQRRAVWEWQRLLFRQELAYISPDAILIMSESQQWLLGLMFGLQNVRRVSMGGWRQIHIEGLDIPIAQTYHPDAYQVPRDRLSQARHDAATYLLDCLERRGRPRDGRLLDPFGD